MPFATMRALTMRQRAGLAFAGVLAALAAVVASSATSGAQGGGQGSFIPSKIECSRTSSGGTANQNLDCEDQQLPIGEPHVAVDPRDPNHIIVTAMNAAECCIQFSTTFDAGHTWVTGSMSAPKPPKNFTGTMADTSVAFDPKHGTVVHLSLNALVNKELEPGDFDVVANVSTNGGRSWGRPIVIEKGSGFGPKEEGNDKPWVTSDTNPSSPFYGRLYVIWDQPVGTPASFAKTTEYGPLLESHSDDGGLTWSKPQVISGENQRNCTYTGLGSPKGQCDRNTFSFPAVAPDGTVYVAFANLQNQRAWEPHEKLEDQYLMVRSDDGGSTWTNPEHVVNMEDGTRDYPHNSSGAERLSPFQAAVTAFGNLAIDPRSGKLFLVFSDNRDGKHDVAHPATRSSVFMVTSKDGRDWSKPRRVSRFHKNQWMPFADVNPRTGRPAILYLDQMKGAGSNFYNVKLAEPKRGSKGRKFERTKVTNGRSRVRDSLWYRQNSADPVGTGSPPCRTCAQWAGDYVALDFGTDGTGNMAWTGMRRRLDLSDSGLRNLIGKPYVGYTEDAFFARSAGR
jgi:hypothetical protein